MRFILTNLYLLLAVLINTQVYAQSVSQTGKVAEVINVKSYTYLRLEEPSTWVATLPQEVKVGDEIDFQGGMSMANFYSKSLDRTFESVVFVQSVNVVKNTASNQTLAGNIKETTLKVEAPKPGEISALEDGQTVAKIYQQSASLNSQLIKLRARVMKVNKKIMGKNWVTLRDGTGTEPNDKLLVTSSEVVSPGDLVIVSGTLQTDVDLGSGYTYKVLLEQASFVTEKQ